MLASFASAIGTAFLIVAIATAVAIALPLALREHPHGRTYGRTPHRHGDRPPKDPSAASGV